MKNVKRTLALLLLLSGFVLEGRTDEPVLVGHWDFSAEGSQPFESHGAVLRDQEGPRPPEFPDFPSNNTAISLGESGGYLSIDDPGNHSDFDFTGNEAIGLEAWVQLRQPSHGSPLVIVGKGRTGNPRFSRDNQNWALRLVNQAGGMHLSFLFATPLSAGDAHWHRWTSSSAFSASSDWHHVAVTYRFGEPESIRGWIDGQPTEGVWDMGGKTQEPPVVDDDQIWIGSANAANRFIGSLDNVSIYRGMLSDQSVAKRFRRVGEKPLVATTKKEMPDLGPLSQAVVSLNLYEGLPSADRWPRVDEPLPDEYLRWTNQAFLLHRLPVRYDDWGIRDDWRAPVLVRMAADVALHPGKNRVLMRARGMGRLWIDGQLVVSTLPVTHKSPDGEQPITPVAQPPLPGHRPHGYRQQEVFGEWIQPKVTQNQQHACRVVLELLVGGPGQRTEPGEVCIAVQSEADAGFHVLAPVGGDVLPLTDMAVEAELTQMERALQSIDDRSRRAAASSQDGYWEVRYRAANQWAESHPPPDVPVLAESPHPVDAFITEKINRAVQAAANSNSHISLRFYGQVLPILSEQCFRCHGEKDKGGLKLNSREAILRAGDSEQAAVVPGDPDSSELMAQIRSGSMPPTENKLSEEQVAVLDQWIREGAIWPAPPVDDRQIAQPAVVDDESFLRRVYLDTTGVPPTLQESADFLSDSHPQRRSRLVERLLQDSRTADHWMSYWQDVLAENPTLLNQSMGSTGPFRWFLYDALRDNKPLDRLVTELILMRGSPDTGGSAGFSLSGESDAPLAEKSHILASAFLGVALQCARCHDSPYHSTTQRDLYSLAAMLSRKSVQVPATSRVPEAFFEKKGRESLIRVTLAPDESVPASWPFADAIGMEDSEQIDALMMNPTDSRERLAVLITAPQNRRFARVMVNRAWKRLMGAGLVEPVDDWEGQTPSHPELLDWLAHKLVAEGYDLRAVLRQILNSQAYQRQALGQNATAGAGQRFFAAPDRRRLSAEQIVDSLHVATGSPMQSEELTFVHDGQRPIGKRQTLGCPTRAWMFASLNNERDRPSLSLPQARVIADVLQAFGWNGSRQQPISSRDTSANVLQPGVLANGSLTMSLTRASLGSTLSQRAIESDSPESLVEEWYLRVLCRKPTAQERETFIAELSVGFENRLVPSDQIQFPTPLPQLPLVTWFNHLQSETNTIQQERERRVRMGPPPDPRLAAAWRTVYEDFVWSLINHREFAWIP